VYLPLVTWLTGVRSRALLLPAFHPWRAPCRWVSDNSMRVEPSLMHPEGGSWTIVRTHTPSKFSKVLNEPLAPIPLDHSKFRENGSQPPPNRTCPSLGIRLSILEFLLSVALAGDFRNCPQCLTCSCRQHSRVLTVEYLWPLGLSPFPSAWGFRLCYHRLYLG